MPLALDAEGHVLSTVKVGSGLLDCVLHVISSLVCALAMSVAVYRALT